MKTAAVAAVGRISIVLGALLVLASIVGIASGGNGFYRSYPAALAGMVGQDVASLVVGLPVLLGSAWFARRGSSRALLVLAGVLFYLAYGYAFFVIGGFNALFPVYALIVAISLYGLLGLLATLDPADVAGRFDADVPRRRVAAFLLGFALLFIVMWGGLTLSLIAGSEQPEPVVHAVLVMDNTVLLPALLLGGSLLWRGSAWGLVLGGVLLVKLVLTGGTLAFATLLDWRWSGELDGFNTVLLVLFGLMAVMGLALLLPFLRHIEDGVPREVARVGPSTVEHA
jgi:hypothetical protein